MHSSLTEAFNNESISTCTLTDRDTGTLKGNGHKSVSGAATQLQQHWAKPEGLSRALSLQEGVNYRDLWYILLLIFLWCIPATWELYRNPGTRNQELPFLFLTMHFFLWETHNVVFWQLCEVNTKIKLLQENTQNTRYRDPSILCLFFSLGFSKFINATFVCCCNSKTSALVKTTS